MNVKIFVVFRRANCKKDLSIVAGHQDYENLQGTPFQLCDQLAEHQWCFMLL